MIKVTDDIFRFDIVIPFYKDYDTIANTFKSIEDQDFKNFTVTVVIDGKDEKAENLITEELKKYIWKINISILDENRGASEARNIGAKISASSFENPEEKSILLFLDADCNLMPGMLMDFAKTFAYRPDIDFIYGNFLTIDKEKSASYKKEAIPFDPYLLQTYNYIPTMSPIRRNVFENIIGFDNLLYFQDWGLFYKASKDGYKGLYVNETLFTTVISKDEDISSKKGTQSEKCKVFRDFYNIPDKDLVVTTIGAPVQAIQRAKMLNADYIGKPISGNNEIYPCNLMFENWKATYVIGLYNNPINALGDHFTIPATEKVIYHFIGTDIWQMLSYHAYKTLEKIAETLKQNKFKILVNSERGQRELSKINIDADLVHTPIYQIEKYFTNIPLPEKFTVGVYISGTNPMNSWLDSDRRSCIPFIKEVAQAMPDVNFKFFGDKALKTQFADNIELCGSVSEKEMPDFINSCSMNLRINIHDGFPQTPIQFMLAGRDALVSCPDKDLLYAYKLSFEDMLDEQRSHQECLDETIGKIYAIKDRQERGEDLGVEAVRKYYSELLDVNKYNEKIRSYINE